MSTKIKLNQGCDIEQVNDDLLDDPPHSEGRFYVYFLIRPDTSEVFYIGESGDPSRIYQHEIDARNGVDNHRSRVIRKIWQENPDAEIEKKIVFRSDDMMLVIEKEKEFIRQYGLEFLTNHRIGIAMPVFKVDPVKFRAAKLELGKLRRG